MGPNRGRDHFVECVPTVCDTLPFSAPHRVPQQRNGRQKKQLGR